MKRFDPNAATRPSCHGSIYVLTLSTCLMVAVIGMASLMQARMSLKQQQTVAKSQQTKQLAGGAASVALASINEGSTAEKHEWTTLLSNAGKTLDTAQSNAEGDSALKDHGPSLLQARASQTDALQGESWELQRSQPLTGLDVLPADGSFENGSGFYSTWTYGSTGGGHTIGRASGAAQDGSYYLWLTGRSSPWDGVSVNLNATNWDNRQSLRLSMLIAQPQGALDDVVVDWVFGLDDSPYTGRLRCVLHPGEAGIWVQHEQQVTLPWDANVTSAKLYIHTAYWAQPLGIDAVKVQRLAPDTPRYAPAPMGQSRWLP